MTNVHLIRHGQASAGTDDYDRLSPTGIRQAELLADYWQKQAFNVDAAFCGSLKRQRHTAELALAGLNNQPALNTLKALNEYDHATIDALYGNGLNSDVAEDFTFGQYLEIMTRWQDAGEQHSEKALSWEAFSMQGWNAVQEMVKANERHGANLVFFTSGGVIASIVKHVMSLKFDTAMHILWQTRNASVTTLLFDQYGTCVVNKNTTPHLQLHFDPSLDTQI